MQRPTWEREKAAWGRGELMCGVDEVGAGAWAGPVYAGAVIFSRRLRLPLLRDSKLLSPQQRETLAVFLKPRVIWAIGRAEVEEIFSLGLRAAVYLAMRRAVAALLQTPTLVLIDAWTIPDLGLSQEGIIHGDALVASIAAASVLAKVERDAWMRGLDKRFPVYGFANHKGYGTAEHQKALHEFGPCPVHRMRYAPLKKLQEKYLK